MVDDLAVRIEGTGGVEVAIRSAHWNLQAALSNDIQVLDKPGPLPAEAQRARNGLDEAVLKLESKTDRLRTYRLGVIDLLDRPAPSRRPRTRRASPSRHRTARRRPEVAGPAASRHRLAEKALPPWRRRWNA